MKSVDLIVDIQPGPLIPEKDLVMVVGGNGVPFWLPRHRRRLARHLAELRLDDMAIAHLRLGEATEEMCASLTDAVSHWLLSKDFGPLVKFACKQMLKKKRSLRIALRTDESLALETTERLAEIPFELLNVPELNKSLPLALHPDVQGIIHALHKLGQPTSPPGMRDWPLRVLIIRASPDDQEPIPKAATLRDHLVEMARNTYGAGHLEVTIFSREAGIGKAAIWKDVQEEIGRRSGSNQFHVLVFIGHGDAREGTHPIGELAFECPSEHDDSYYETWSVDALQLGLFLSQHPIPVVVLAGCWTAAGVGAQPSPSVVRTRATQILAKELIQDSSGVHLAVGMRYQISTTDAPEFLEAFFDSLLAKKPGNVEAAVGAGRSRLYLQRRYPPSWSAPVVFRALGPEPTLDFLSMPPPSKGQADLPLDDIDEHIQKLRREMWTELSNAPHSRRSQTDRSRLEHKVLQNAEDEFLQRARDRDVVILMPDSAEVLPGQSVKVPILLSMPLYVLELKGWLVFDAKVLARQCQPSQALREAGFMLLTDPSTPGTLFFRIERKYQGTRPALLPAGPLFEVDCGVGTYTPVFYEMGVRVQKLEPPAPVFGWDNALIVPPP